MSKHLFLYKDNTKSGDRDCVFYVEDAPGRFECGHYFSRLRLAGSCFSAGLDEETDYDTITTVLTKEEFEALKSFNSEIGKLGYGIKFGDERFKQGNELRQSIAPIFDKLNSHENKDLFAEVVEEEIKWLHDELGICEDDVREIFDKLCSDFMDRGAVSHVFGDLHECAYEEAHALGYANDQNDRWFDYELFGEDLMKNEDGDKYIELSDGRIAVLNIW